MKKHSSILFTITMILLLTSCRNDVEEIKNPSTGKLMKRYEYYSDDSGQKIKDGEYVEWDYLGNKMSKLQYKDDSLNGPAIFYNEDGSIANYNYLKGKLDGEQTLKSKQGDWIYKENYTNGIPNGTHAYYHSNGKLMCSGNFALGVQVGKWKYLDDMGNPSFNLTFKNGVCQELIGTWELKERAFTTFAFREDGTYTLKAPYFKYSQNSVVQGEGQFTVTRTLQLSDENRNGIWDYEVFEVEKDRLILINYNTEAEEAILDLRKR